jgi:hypothetical protein
MPDAAPFGALAAGLRAGGLSELQANVPQINQVAALQIVIESFMISCLIAGALRAHVETLQ